MREGFRHSGAMAEALNMVFGRTCLDVTSFNGIFPNMVAAGPPQSARGGERAGQTVDMHISSQLASR